MILEDSWGGDIVTAAISHLAHSTPPELLLASTDFNSYVTVDIAQGAPRRQEGRMRAPEAPGWASSPAWTSSRQSRSSRAMGAVPGP